MSAILPCVHPFGSRISESHPRRFGRPRAELQRLRTLPPTFTHLGQNIGRDATLKLVDHCGFVDRPGGAPLHHRALMTEDTTLRSVLTASGTPCFNAARSARRLEAHSQDKSQIGGKFQLKSFMKRVPQTKSFAMSSWVWVVASVVRVPVQKP